MTDSVSPRPLFPKSGPCHTHRRPGPPVHPAAQRPPPEPEDWRGPLRVQGQPGYSTGFHTAHRSDVNCPSDGAIVTVIDRADVAKLFATISPASEVRSQ